ncbi:MAG: hypothetical protein NT172_21035 [Planctomycetota bacterium]|nr:hypothetical protein [Planctomycetota bacterium]
MAMKISVGLQKKVGQPNFGSLGASCHVEFEIDPSLVENNIDGFHNKVNGAFLACRQAVNAQLRQQGSGAVEAATAIQKQLPARQPDRRPESQRGGTVTPNQLKAIYGLARRHRLDPQKLVHERFDRYVPEDLTIREASELLDELKQDRSVARSTA